MENGDKKEILAAMEKIANKVDNQIKEHRQEMRKEFKIANDKIDRNLKEVKKVMFGEDGIGGITRNVVDLTTIVCGVKDVPDSRGLTGAVADIEHCLIGTQGKPGLKQKLQEIETTANDLKTKQTWWNRGLSGAVILAWVKAWFGIIGGS